MAPMSFDPNGTGRLRPLTLKGRLLASVVAARPATAAEAVLTAAALGNPVWASLAEPKLRHPPRTLVNPIEPGIARDESRPGTGIEPIVPMTSWDKTGNNAGDPRQDLLIIGKVHTTGAATPGADVVRSSALKIAGYRHVRLIGHDLGDTQLAFNRPYGDHHVEGVRGDYYNAVETDAIAARGAEIGSNEVASVLTLQNVHVRGMRGTNRSHDAGTAISAIAVSTTKTVKVNNVNTTVIDQIVVDLSAAAPGGAPPSGRAVILGSTLLDGTKSQPLEGFNDTWYVASSPASTATKLYLNAAELIESKTFTTSAGSGGIAWVCGTGTGQHADGAQNENIIPYTGVAVASVTIAALGTNGRASKVDVVLSSAASAVPVAGRQVVLKDTYLDGVYSEVGQGFNDTWKVAASPAPTLTAFSLISPLVPDARPASGTGSSSGTYTGAGTAPTGRAFITTTTDEVYTPGTVPNRKFRYAAVRFDRVTMYTQYQGYIGGAWGQDFFAARCNFVHSLKRPGVLDSAANAYLDPMDSSSGLIYLYTAEGMTPQREFYEVLLSNRPRSSLLGGGGIYEGGGNSMSGTVDGVEVVWFQTGHPAWKGVVKRGTVPLDGATGLPLDYADYATLGNKYSSPGYSGYALDGTGALNDITLALDVSPVPESLGGEGSIGWVDVLHSTVGEIVDVRVSGGRDKALVKLKGANLVRGARALDYDTAPVDKTLQIELTARVRGITDATATATNTITRSFAIPLGDVAAPAGASSTLNATWTAIAVDPGAGSPAGTYTFAGVSIGPAVTLGAGEGRFVAVCLTADVSSTTRTLSPILKDGVAMAPLSPLNAQFNAGPSATTFSQFFIAEASAGAETANFVVPFNASMANASINVWQVLGFAAGSNPSAFDSAAAGNVASTSGLSIAASVASVAGGAVLAGAQVVGATSTSRAGAASANIAVGASDLTIAVAGASGNITFTASSALTPGATLPVEVSDLPIENAGCRPVLSIVSLAPQG